MDLHYWKALSDVMQLGRRNGTASRSTTTKKTMITSLAIAAAAVAATAPPKKPYRAHTGHKNKVTIPSSSNKICTTNTKSIIPSISKTSNNINNKKAAIESKLDSTNTTNKNVVASPISTTRNTSTNKKAVAEPTLNTTNTNTIKFIATPINTKTNPITNNKRIVVASVTSTGSNTNIKKLIIVPQIFKTTKKKHGAAIDNTSTKTNKRRIGLSAIINSSKSLSNASSIIKNKKITSATSAGTSPRAIDVNQATQNVKNNKATINIKSLFSISSDVASDAQTNVTINTSANTKPDVTKTITNTNTNSVGTKTINKIDIKPKTSITNTSASTSTNTSINANNIMAKKKSSPFGRHSTKKKKKRNDGAHGKRMSLLGSKPQRHPKYVPDGISMMSAASPEQAEAGTLTPPGSSPLRAECEDTAPSSTPCSPQAPPTPDSAHMISHTANERLHPTTEPHTDLSSSYDHHTTVDSANRKRKATDTYTHKQESECGSEGEGDAAAGSAVVVAGNHAPLTCPVCQEVLLGQHDFTQHIRKHNHVIEADNGTRMYACGICKKQLSSNSSLDRHMLVHSGERPFRCHICGTHFTTNGNMHRHIRGHYRNGGGGPEGSDTGESDIGSDTGSSPKKRRLEDDESLSAKSPRIDEKELSCPVCGLEQANQHALGLHVEAAHPEYQVACNTCQLGFKNYRALHLHNSMVHADSPQPTQPHIDLMNTEFSTSKFPLIVKEFHEANSRLQLKEVGAHFCIMCNISFSNVESYSNHMAEHKSAVTSPLRCLRCDISFTNVAELAQHHHRHLGEEAGYPPPPKESFLAVLDLLTKQQVAPSPSSTVASLLGWKPPLMLPPPGQHSPAHADSAKASPEHPISGHTLIAPPSMTPMPPMSPMAPMLPPGTTLSHEEQFTREYRDMKLNGQYPCRLCKEVFANLRKLKSHNLIHMVAPPYRCNLCTFYSNDKNTLKEHMKSHKGDTPYECTICNLAFTTKANCERHIKNIHARNTRDEIKTCMTFVSQDECSLTDRSMDTICHICHIDCKARSVLRDHMRSSHPEGMEKPFACKLCGSSFSSENDVMRHAIQQHNDMVRGNRLENLVMPSQRHIFRDDNDDENLSSVDKLVHFAKIPLLPFPRVAPPQPQISVHPIPNPICIPNPLLPQQHLVNPLISSLVSTTVEEDAPLDLSMSWKKELPKEDEEEKYEEEEEELKVDDDEEEKKIKEEHQEEPEDLSSKRKEDYNEPTEVKPEHLHADILRIPKPPFPLGGVYPPHLPLTAFPPHQYPFLMPPYGGLPPGYNFDPAILEEYQKELKRGLQLTSGGGLLPGGGFLQNGTPTFPLSALALAATQRDPLRIPRPEFRNLEIKTEERPTEERLSKPGEEDILHFTMRNSVLVKKPKQRRYRTERPWRCDLCDKGFTLRSNMERHMKQQHPDLWQQRPRVELTETPRLDGDISSSVSDSGHALSDAVREQLRYRLDRDADDETGEHQEEDDIELVIDDEPEEEEECEEDEGESEDEYEEDEEEGERRQEEGGADLASVHTLLSTATSQSFPFFGSEGEEDQGAEDEDSCESSNLSKNVINDEKNDEKRSAYSSAPQKQRCPFCQRKFPWSSSLVRHIRTHTGQKPYLCPVCHFPFTTKSNCDRHLIRKHPDSPHTLGGDRPFRCPKCPGAAFTSLESLRKHEMFKHEKASDTAIPRDDTRPFRCHVCEARLASRDAALVHVTEAHPEHVQSIRTTSPPPKDNNNDILMTSPDSTTTDMVACMFCLQRCWSLAELKQHVTNHHVNGPSSSDSEDQPACMPSTTPKTEVKEERKDEVEGTDFISNLLGTRRAVIDNLLNSKSADDAAKLLGVH